MKRLLTPSKLFVLTRDSVGLLTVKKFPYWIEKIQLNVENDPLYSQRNPFYLLGLLKQKSKIKGPVKTHLKYCLFQSKVRVPPRSPFVCSPARPQGSHTHTKP